MRDILLETLMGYYAEQVREHSRSANSTVTSLYEKKPKTFKPMKFNMYVPHAVMPDVKVKCKLT